MLLLNYYFTFIDYLGVLEYHLVPIGVEAVAKVLVNLVRLSVLPLDEEGRLGFTWLVLAILLLLLILIEEEPDRSLVPVHSQSREGFVEQALIVELHGVVSLDPDLLSAHGVRHQSFKRFPLESQESAN